jgi:peptidoglycan hydrolase CwlO-like protein
MEAEAAAAQERLAELQGEVGAAYEAYEEALTGLEALNSDISATGGELMEAEKELVEAQGNLEDQASRVYRSGNVGFIDVLVGVESFSDFAARMELWVRVLGQQQAEVNRVGELRDALAADRAALEQQREDRSAAVEAAAGQRTEAAELEAETMEYLNSLDGQMQATVQAQLFADAEAQARQDRILEARERENALAESLRQQGCFFLPVGGGWKGRGLRKYDSPSALPRFSRSEVFIIRFALYMRRWVVEISRV